MPELDPDATVAAEDGPPIGRSRALVALVVGFVVALAVAGVIWVNAGDQGETAASLPDVRDVSVEVALERLAAVGVGEERVRISRQRTDAADPGTILSQSPQAGEEVPVSGQVLLVVALGDDAPVPDVVGLEQAEAVAALEAAGFAAEVVEEPSDRAAGRVLETDPPPGRDTPTGSVVVVTVSVDPDAPFEVPDVVGDEVVVTVARLRDLGLEVEVLLEASPLPKGTVLRTEPGPASELRQGDAIRVVASAGPDGASGDPWPGTTDPTGTGDGGGSPTTTGGGGAPTSGGGGSGTTAPPPTTERQTTEPPPTTTCRSVTIQPGYQDPDSGDYVPPVTQIQCS